MIGITYFNIGICTNLGGGGVLLVSLSPYFLITRLDSITHDPSLILYPIIYLDPTRWHTR